MLAAGLEGLASLPIQRVIIVSLARYFTPGVERELTESVYQVLQIRPEFVLLENPTPSMVDTISAGIEHLPHDQPILVKDTDNLVQPNVSELPKDINSIFYADLSVFQNVRAFNKSFVEMDGSGLLTNIIEKRIVSGRINTGLVGFASASDFLLAASKLKGSSEKFVSDVIRVVLELGGSFSCLPVQDYEDWGTYKEWIELRHSYENLVVWLEGVIFQEESSQFQPDAALESQILTTNAHSLLKRLNSEKPIAGKPAKKSLTYLANFPEIKREVIEATLIKLGFKEFNLLLGMPRAKSIIVSSYSGTEPPPNSSAVEIQGNSDSLGHHLP